MSKWTGILGIGILSIAAFVAHAQQLIPPNITSDLDVTATKGDFFTYQILANGDTPMSFTAVPLPLTLTLTDNTISGVLREAGTFNIMLTVFNMAGSQDRILRLTVLNNGASLPPVFISPPQATPNPAIVGTPVVFTAVASDPEGDSLTYAWEFGDSLIGAGASTFHTFAFAGIYTVVVTASDGQNSASGSLQVVITDDSGGGGGGIVNEFQILRTTVTFNFKRANKDRLALTGEIPLEAAFRPAGTPVSATIGGLTRSFTLNARGSAGDANNVFTLQGPARFGTGTVALPVGFMLILRQQDLFSQLQSLGFVNADVRRQPITFSVQLTFDGQDFGQNVAVRYSARQNKRGFAK